MYTRSDATQDGWKGAEADRYVAYHAQVDAEVVKLIGMNYDDLPDMFDLASAFQARVSPKVAAKRAVAAARRELGY